MPINFDCEAFVSAPIRLAARILERRRNQRVDARQSTSISPATQQQATTSRHEAQAQPNTPMTIRHARQLPIQTDRRLAVRAITCPSVAAVAALCSLLLSVQVGCELVVHRNSQLISNTNTQHTDDQHQPAHAMRHHAHYLNFVPSAHFSYQEGRQFGARSLGDDSAAAATAPAPEAVSSSHIYKRSSAVLPGGGSGAASNPLSRRMMSTGGASGQEQQQQLQQDNRRQQSVNWLGVASDAAAAAAAAPAAELTYRRMDSGSSEATTASSSLQQNNRKQTEHEAELLRQKQHIQYHDQWPSMAGKCHKRTLNFCASVLPFNTTTFPNIIGDTNRFEVKRSLPFFGFLAKSSCNKRLDELLCLLLEPPCSAHSGSAIPPCKKFCRLALEGCNEYIPATLALSSVFDCRQYPDSNDPNVCINLAQGSKCAADEFKCPDKTCIPRNWLCDGVRDCIFAADEANCTATPQVSVCSTEEFKCDGKCVPKAWKCDGERDCLDGSDEESCHLRPRCGPDRFKCHDGNGCIPKRWVCDGKAECRDGSDEVQCEQRECSDNDFKCDTGICIPKLWRCDRQFDCKDGSDERNCVYPTPTTTTTTTTNSPPPTTLAVETTTTSAPIDLAVNATSSYEIHQQAGVQAPSQQGDAKAAANYYATGEPSAADANQRARQQQQLEFSLSGDVSRIIQHESAASSSSPSSSTASEVPSSAASGEPLDVSTATTIAASTTTTQGGDLHKFDYDLIQSANSLAQMNELVAAQQQATGSPSTSEPPTRGFTNGAPASDQQQQQQQQRLPIYRSFFKSFKGPHGRGQLVNSQQQQQQANGQRNVVAIARRRRDRVHHLPLLRQPEPAAPEHLAPPFAPMAGGQQVAVAPQAGRNQPQSAAVASYLQLLNNRYNLRLPHVVA